MLCDEQDNLDTIRTAFELELQEEHTAALKKVMMIGEEEKLSKDQQTTVDEVLKKKMGDVMSSIRVVKSGGNYAFIQWDDGYHRTPEEEKAWKKVSVMSTASASRESDERC